MSQSLLIITVHNSSTVLKWVLLVSTQTQSSAWCTLTHLLWLLERTTQRIALKQIWALCLEGYTSSHPVPGLTQRMTCWHGTKRSVPLSQGETSLVMSFVFWSILWDQTEVGPDCHLCSRVSVRPHSCLALSPRPLLFSLLPFFWKYIHNKSLTQVSLS